jgi:8-oxo-dGTP pyrophosphatase MutT (NUDIX family)
MEKITHKGKLIEVVQRNVEQNGKIKTFEFARRSPGIRLIISKGDNILLTKEFRHEIGGYDYRLPGGKVYNSLDEYNTALKSHIDIARAAKDTAIKEAYEETGINVKDITFLHRSICGATIVWDLFYFLVEDFTDTDQHLEDGEDIKVQMFNRDEIRKMCLDGRIGEERSALIMLRYLEGEF